MTFVSNSDNDTWSKAPEDTTGNDWNAMTDSQKNDIVSKIIAKLNTNGNKIVKDNSWYIQNINDFYNGGDTSISVLKAASLITAGGAATQEQQDKAQTEMSQQSDRDKEIWQYCKDRWSYYDQLEGGYSGDKHTQDVFNAAAAHFGITASEVESVWDRVDKASLGISNQ